MTTHPDEKTLANIRKGRTYKEQTPDNYMTQFTSLAEMMDSWTAEQPEKVYLIHYDGDGNRDEFTYREFDNLVNQTANFLVERLGVKRGDRVATIGYNHSDTAVIYFACWKLGAAVAPQNVAEDDERIGFILNNSEAVALLAREEYFDRMTAIVKGDNPVANVREIVQVGGETREGTLHYHTEIKKQPTTFTPAEPITQEDEVLLVYTSGTTGRPKGVVLTHYNMMADAQAVANWNGLTREQRTMCVLPIHHVNGIEMTLIMPYYMGASTVLNRAYSPRHFWQRIAKENVQIVSLVPTLLQFSLEFAEKQEAAGKSIWGDGITTEDVSGFRHFICGAGTLAVGLATAFEEKFHIRILHGYGLSETTCYSCFVPSDDDWDTHRKWMSGYGYPSIGVPISSNEMAIFDASGSGEQLGAGQRGEICIRGHNVMKYYLYRPDVNTETFKFGWFRSGDEGFFELDDQGRQMFFITGRLKELINRGGVKFSPFDIEETLLEMPEINTPLAVAFENDYYGEEVGAYVVLNEGQSLTEADILDYCRAQMSFEKSPKVVVFGTEIPITSTGKYQRLKLRDLFSEWKTTQFKKSR